MDGFGNATIVWRTGTQIRSRERYADGTLSLMHGVTNTRTFGLYVFVGVDAADDAAVAWEDHGVRVRIRNAEGNWGPIRRISLPGEETVNLQFAVNSRGDAAFAWERDHDRSLFGGTLAADGALSRAGMVAPGPFGGYAPPQVAITDAGRAVFVWSGDSGGTIQTRTQAPNGSFTGVQTLSQDGGGEADVGVDKEGNAIFAWRGSDGDSCGPTGAAPSCTIEVRTRATDGTLGPTQVFKPASEYPNDALAVNPDGDASVVWESPSGVQAAFLP